jgi:capsular exopolysaccharide synthesis family protein
MPSNEPATQSIDYPHYLNIILRRRWIVLAVWLIVMIFASLYAFITKPVFQGSALLLIEKERGGGLVQAANGTFIESSNDDYYQTQYRLLKSESLLRQVYERMNLQADAQFGGPHGLDRLKAVVAIAPILRSRLVYIHAQALHPRVAAAIANVVADTFVDQNLANQLFISKEILQTLQQRSQQGASRQSIEALPAVVNNLLIQQLKTEFSKLQAQHADMSARLTPKHPTMIALRSNMNSLESQIRAETDKVVQSLKSELSGQLKGNNVRVVDPARVPESPVHPRKGKILFTAGIAGLMIGFLLALAVEAIDQSIRTQDDVENILGLPFLGAIPLGYFKQDEKIYSHMLTDKLSLTSEAFRNLRTMVDFSKVDQRSASFLVTSTVQEEGKSFVSSNLAVSLSQLGEKVLLVDGDLRRARLHKNFGLSNERGLSRFLSRGETPAEIAGLIQETGIPNLHILPCGARPPNPSELLNTPRLGALVQWCTQHYQRVLIDCTPLFPINDALLWGRHIPFAVFVVYAGTTRTPLIQKACQKLAAGGVKNLGIAINKSLPSSLAYAPYGYYYHQYRSHYHGNREPAEHAQAS